MNNVFNSIVEVMEIYPSFYGLLCGGTIFGALGVKALNISKKLSSEGLKAYRLNKNLGKKLEHKDINKVVVSAKYKPIAKKSFDTDTSDNKTEFNEQLKEFERVIRSNFSKEVLGNFERNYSQLRLYMDRGLDANGGYRMFDNVILLNTTNPYVVFHELFHMASSWADIENDILYTGFDVYINNYCMGEGINEGYTELMSNRYFNKKAEGYPFNFEIAKKIEEIVGRERMEGLYLTSNIRG